jgi:hypothetical protein
MRLHSVRRSLNRRHQAFGASPEGNETSPVLPVSPVAETASSPAATTARKDERTALLLALTRSEMRG